MIFINTPKVLIHAALDNQSFIMNLLCDVIVPANDHKPFCQWYREKLGLNA